MGREKMAWLLLCLAITAAAESSRADEGSIFKKPVWLQADGKDIDTGDVHGHSGPCLADFDGDGLRPG
jgi:hypothetical protein